MKLSAGCLILTVVLILAMLGQLRYSPWDHIGPTTACDVIHEGSNKKGAP